MNRFRKNTLRFILLCFSFVCFPAMACQSDMPSIQHEDEYSLSYQFSDNPIELGKHFSISIWVCKDDRLIDIDRLRADAIMPSHGHGMNYDPEITSLELGKFKANGLLFHMPGDWQIIFDVFLGKKKYTFKDNYQLQ